MYFDFFDHFGLFRSFLNNFNLFSIYFNLFNIVQTQFNQFHNDDSDWDDKFRSKKFIKSQFDHHISQLVNLDRLDRLSLLYRLCSRQQTILALGQLKVVKTTKPAQLVDNCTCETISFPL